MQTAAIEISRHFRDMDPVSNIYEWADIDTLMLLLGRVTGDASSSFDKEAAVAMYTRLKAAGGIATLQDVVDVCDEWLDSDAKQQLPGPVRDLGYTSYKAFYPLVRDEVNYQVRDQLNNKGADVYSVVPICVNHMMRIAVKCLRGAAMRKML